MEYDKYLLKSKQADHSEETCDEAILELFQRWNRKSGDEPPKQTTIIERIDKVFDGVRRLMVPSITCDEN